MPKLVRTRTTDGQRVEFIDEVVGSGGLKDAYFSPDKSYVVCFFREPQDERTRERLQMIVSTYRERIFSQAGGDYWKKVFCWPSALVEWQGRIGVVAPTYPAHFFFQHGSKNDDFLGIRGHEKQGKWFASANNQSRFLDARERGDWRNYLRIGLLIARALRRMHSAGLAHSDLSYKNVLVDPVGGHACIIDIDGLVVPGKFPPDVVGTPDFIAPEVVMASHLKRDDPLRKLPSIATDRHALAVLIYMYLLYRHPLRGDQVHDSDPQTDETLSMGARALFVEHPHDASNRVLLANARPGELPWKDTQRIPYTLGGPYLSALFRQAFIDGLHDPAQRPTADDWETALIKTLDVLLPCSNSRCLQQWYVFDNSLAPECPFCATPHRGRFPVLNLYSSREEGKFLPDNYRLTVYASQLLFPWHANRHIAPNERLTEDQQRPVGRFVQEDNVWWLVNDAMPDLLEIKGRRPVPVGERVALEEGQQLLLSRDVGGRLVMVQMVGV